MRPVRIEREDFLENYWPGLYHDGDHVLTLGPTQRAGKTHLNFQLLQAVGHPWLDKTVFCMKPRDATVARWSEALGYKETERWPPPAKWFWQDKPNGYTLWPRHSFDPDKDNEHLRQQFRATMMHHYRSGDAIMMLDEVYGICAELNLSKELIAIATRGGGMGCGAWMASQKPSGTQQGSLPGFIFNCPRHYFLAADNDARNRARYTDISGGFDPKFIESTTLGLQRFEFLYINADGQVAVIGA